MFLMNLAPGDPANPILVMILTALSLVSIFPLIVLIEYVALQLLRWGKFRPCLNAAIRVNLVTFVLGVGLMLAFPEPNTWQLLIYLAFSIVVETSLLSWLKRGAWKSNLMASIIANAASYVILILPAFRFR